MRSFIKQPDKDGISAIVAQQFELAAEVLATGLVPIIEPEIDIHSAGYSRAEATRILARNHSVIASFARALLEGLGAGQSEFDFDTTLDRSIGQIFEASIT